MVTAAFTDVFSIHHAEKRIEPAGERDFNRKYGEARTNSMYGPDSFLPVGLQISNKVKLNRHFMKFLTYKALQPWVSL
jgi:hypothetical protein